MITLGHDFSKRFICAAVENVLHEILIAALVAEGFIVKQSVQVTAQKLFHPVSH